jgi:hypothetical protein
VKTIESHSIVVTHPQLELVARQSEMMEVRDMVVRQEEAIMDHVMNLEILFHHQLLLVLPLEFDEILQTQDYEISIQTVAWDRKEEALQVLLGMVVDGEEAIPREEEVVMGLEVHPQEVSMVEVLQWVPVPAQWVPDLQVEWQREEGKEDLLQGIPLKETMNETCPVPMALLVSSVLALLQAMAQAKLLMDMAVKNQYQVRI